MWLNKRIYITILDMVQNKIMCMSVCMHKCMCVRLRVWKRMIKQMGLNGNDKWIWVKVYGYSLYCSFSYSCRISFKLFASKKFKNKKIYVFLIETEHFSRILTLSTDFISPYFSFGLFHLICWLNTKLKAGSVFM